MYSQYIHSISLENACMFHTHIHTCMHMHEIGFFLSSYLSNNFKYGHHFGEGTTFVDIIYYILSNLTTF